MKHALFWFLFCLSGVLCAQSQTDQQNDIDKLKEGDELPEGGVYWDLQSGKGQLNLRFHGNNLRLYFVDEGGLIMEPTFPVALARYYNDLRSSVKVPRDVATLKPSSNGVYLTSSRILQPPLRYRVWVVLQETEPDASATQDDALTPDKQSYGLRILNGIGSGSNTQLGN